MPFVGKSNDVPGADIITSEDRHERQIFQDEYLGSGADLLNSTSSTESVKNADISALASIREPVDEVEPTPLETVVLDSTDVSTTARTSSRCPFSFADKPINLENISKCPFHAHVTPKKVTVTQPVPLNIHGRTHHTSKATATLLQDIGGGDRIREFCTRFYALFFEDKVLSQFIFEKDGAEAHGKRLADWIIQKMDENRKPWSESGRWGMRQPSHFRAWNNDKRHISVRGDHFKLDDTRMWMRLHFWAVREVGLGPKKHEVFFNWYKKFIGHFIAIYERQAPVFVDESAAWSSNKANIMQYLNAGRRFDDIIVPRPGYA